MKPQIAFKNYSFHNDNNYMIYVKRHTSAHQGAIFISNQRRVSETERNFIVSILERQFVGSNHGRTVERFTVGARPKGLASGFIKIHESCVCDCQSR